MYNVHLLSDLYYMYILNGVHAHVLYLSNLLYPLMISQGNTEREDAGFAVCECSSIGEDSSTLGFS